MVARKRLDVPVPLALLCGLLLRSPSGGAQLEPPAWQKPYAGEEATGNHVIALWQFNAGEPAKDNSGHGHDLVLRGQSRFAPQGKFGGCLESFSSGEKSDQRQGAEAKNHPSLSPQGAFTLEMWFQPKPEMEAQGAVFLLDKKYYHYASPLPHANRDYCLFLRRAGTHQRQIVASLGYGTDSAAYTSRPVELLPGTWYHVAFLYDGAGGGRFFLNGEAVGRTAHPGRGPTAPGGYPLVLGDRCGSNYAGFPGFIDEVRISKGAVTWLAGRLELDLAGSRTSFVRMERGAEVRVHVTNDCDKPLSQCKAVARLGADRREWALPDLDPSGTHAVAIPVNTAWRPGRYVLQVSVSGTAEGKTYETAKEFPVAIAPRLPPRMPVVMWGTGDLPTVKSIGFTHQLIHPIDFGKVWAAGGPTEAMAAGQAAELAETLDQYLAEGVGAVASLSPGSWVVRDEANRARFARIDRQAKPYADPNVCGLFPEVQSFAYHVGASVARSFGQFPALQAALIHTEVRDHTQLCFHPHDREAFRKFAGFDIPDSATSKWGVRYTRTEGFPANRVVPEDHPLLIFYRWLWKEGDGWNALHSQVHRGLKSTGREDLWTFFDPAVRAPSVWGSGGNVDVISQWTYSYPDPIKIGQAADELLAMADGAPRRQQVMKMTQIIWYRSQTAPELPKDESRRAGWEKEIPDAKFITIAPDHLREAFWSKIARPVQGIMYHGWGSLVRSPHASYRFTNPQTREVLAELIRQVVEPLGPMLMQVPDRKSDLALLESFAAQVFAGRGTYGWSHRWEADMHLILQWARYQPRIVYEETILRDGLEPFRVLVMPHCDVLTERVARAIADFQKRGGIVVADEHLAPAIRADITVASYQRTGKAEADKAALQQKAAALRQELGGRYQPYGDSSDPDVVVRVRQWGTTDYLFAVNDKRTFGDYVGHHGKVMERGLAHAATLSVPRPGGHVYDLVTHAAVPAATRSGVLAFEAAFPPGGGGVFMVTEHAIADVRLDAPAEARRGAPLRLEAAVVDAEDRPLDAVIPVQLEVLDPQGRAAEFSGHYGAQEGKLALTIDVAENDLPGEWTVRVRELASGKMRQRGVAVR